MGEKTILFWMRIRERLPWPDRYSTGETASSLITDPNEQEDNVLRQAKGVMDKVAAASFTKTVVSSSRRRWSPPGARGLGPPLLGARRRPFLQPPSVVTIFPFGGR